MVGEISHDQPLKTLCLGPKSQRSIFTLDGGSPGRSSTRSIGLVGEAPVSMPALPYLRHFVKYTDNCWEILSPGIARHRSKVTPDNRSQELNHAMHPPNVPRRRLPQRLSALPQYPDISNIHVPANPNAEYAILISMYEVYNDRIFDLLSVPGNQKEFRRRGLLFKSTESSPDRKVVAGLRKVVCGSYEEALMILETGLIERRVAGTGSNSVSSRSHGFFCAEVKKRPRGIANAWTATHLTVVDLAGGYFRPSNQNFIIKSSTRFRTRA